MKTFKLRLKEIFEKRANKVEELKERLRDLIATCEYDTEQYKIEITNLDNEFNQICEQLTSDIKLLEDALNWLKNFEIN